MLAALRLPIFEPFHAVTESFPTPQGFLQKIDRVCLGVANCITKPIERRFGLNARLQAVLAKAIPQCVVPISGLSYGAAIYLMHQNELPVVVASAVSMGGFVFLGATETPERGGNSLSGFRATWFGAAALFPMACVFVGVATGYVGLGLLGAACFVMNSSSEYLRATDDLPTKRKS